MVNKQVLHPLLVHRLKPFAIILTYNADNLVYTDCVHPIDVALYNYTNHISTEIVRTFFYDFQNTDFTTTKNGPLKSQTRTKNELTHAKN